MARIVQVTVPLLATAVGFCVGAYLGNGNAVQQGRFQAALAENKVAADNLSNESLGPELREYLKGRIYYNIATEYPNTRGYLLRKDWDFGPVDRRIMRGSIYAKDPNYDTDSFDAATAHLSNAQPKDVTSSSQPSHTP